MILCDDFLDGPSRILGIVGCASDLYLPALSFLEQLATKRGKGIPSVLNLFHQSKSNVHEESCTIEIWILNTTQSTCSHFGASLSPRETMEDQLRLLVEKGKAKRAELLGKADPDATATSPTSEVAQIDWHVLYYFFSKLWLLGRSCLFSLDASQYFGNPIPVGQERSRASFNRTWRLLLWELSFKKSPVQSPKNLSAQVMKIRRKDPRKRRLS